MTEAFERDSCPITSEQDSGDTSSRRSFIRVAAAMCLGGAGGCSVVGKREKAAHVPLSGMRTPECIKEGKLYKFTYDFDPDIKDRKRATRNDMSGRREKIRLLNRYITQEWVPENNFAGKSMRISLDALNQKYQDADEPIVLILEIDPWDQEPSTSALPSAELRTSQEFVSSSRTQTPEVHQK